MCTAANHKAARAPGSLFPARAAGEGTNQGYET